MFSQVLWLKKKKKRNKCPVLGGQGDAALFGINGFNMLLDGGYSRKACFWDFVRHLDRQVLQNFPSF